MIYDFGLTIDDFGLAAIHNVHSVHIVHIAHNVHPRRRGQEN